MWSVLSNLLQTVKVGLHAIFLKSELEPTKLSSYLIVTLPCILAREHDEITTCSSVGNSTES